jgi:hypothetical protein
LAAGHAVTELCVGQQLLVLHQGVPQQRHGVDAAERQQQPLEEQPLQRERRHRRFCTNAPAAPTLSSAANRLTVRTGALDCR